MFPANRFTLRVTLLSLITTILLGAVLTLSIYNYVRSTQTAIAIAGDLLREVNDKAIIKIQSMFGPVLALGKRIQELPALGEKPVLLAHPVTAYLIDTLESYPYIYSVFMGYADDDFFQIIALDPDDEAERRQIKAPEGCRFALRRIMRRDNGVRVEIWRFLDKDCRTVGSRFENGITFRPTARPWFPLAYDQDEVVHTQPYPFASSNSLGLTVARRFDGRFPGVFGIDMTLSSISRFLAGQKIGTSGVAFLFNDQGLLLAHPNPHLYLKKQAHRKGAGMVPALLSDLDDPIISEISNRFARNPGETGGIRFAAAGREYVGSITQVPDNYLPGSYMAVVAPIADFTEDIVRTRNESLLFTVLLLLAALPIIVLLSRSVTSRLQALSREADRIREFDLGETPKISSHIKEISHLAYAVEAMKIALRSFGQYVPSSLVAKIVSGELHPRLGGSRKPLTLLFTDIADFTTLSESADPEALMEQVSVYFRKMGTIILSHHGTIDKYIGDAIMAFWNAPTTDEEHVSHACAAALRAAAASNELNRMWRESGKPELYTRLGLHSGNCIVGNVGSSDRMDYTAMGDTVNMASRLEGLNKYMQTQILASRQVRDQAGDGFAFRPVGRVMPKGKHIPTDVYELVGFAGETDMDWIGRWQDAYERFMARDFGGAAEAFGRLLRERPDGVARKFAESARRFCTAPPPDDWDGVETFSAK
ncbi:MAG: adenylate/guanylate cyclase domain-containing protein [Pseudodesulfovibrio sp.]